MTDPGRNMRDEAVHARRVLGAMSGWFPYVVQGEEEPAYIAYAGAYVARCARLLAAVTSLVENGHTDAVGAIYRTLLETYLHGVYVLLGKDEALDALLNALRHEAHALEVPLELSTKDERPDGAEQLRVSGYKRGDGLVERVDRLLVEHNEAYRGWAQKIHNNHYRVLSFHDVHGGLGALKDHVIKSDNEQVRVVATVDASGVALSLLSHAVSLVGSFAGLWAGAVGADTEELANALELWWKTQPDG
jgi:hypothetical protein